MGAEREFEGKTVDEALRAASEALGIPVGDLQYDMLEEGRRGVLGLGARQVRIRVEHAPIQAAPGPTAPPGGGKGAIPAARSLEKTLGRMLGLMGLDLRIRVESSGNGVRLSLGGRDQRMLLSKDAQLLSALQFLLNRMGRRAWPEAGRIQVQCDGHRNRRDEELVELVREVAEQVATTGRAKQLHPMNPYERRLTHLTVREFSGLASRSEGDGPLKKITVAPERPGPNRQ